MKIFILICNIFLLNFANAKQSSQLSVKESYTVPAIEISGMAWRNNPATNKKELVLVSDRNYALYIINWAERKTKFKVNKIDLLALKSKDDGAQSEWESIFCDESGRVFIVKESPAKLIVLSPDLKTIEKTILLNHLLPNQKSNSGAEGLLLLNNGHFLVVNEKDKLEIIEFGPASEKPSGFTPAISMENNGQFPLEKLKEKYAVLHSWKPDKNTLKHLKDSSGVNTDHNKRLYLLSDEKETISLIGDQLSSKVQSFSGIRYWKLPRRMKNPEGMVINKNGNPIIAVDIKKTDRPNLFVLSDLE